MEGFCLRPASRHQVVLEHGGELERALHHKTVCTDWGEDVVHLRERLDHAIRLQRAGHVEEHHIGLHLLVCQQFLRIVQGVHRITRHYRIGVLLDFAEMVAGQCLEVEAFLYQFQLALTQTVNAVLRGIAVHHRHIQPHHIVKVTCGKGSDGGFADASFLCRKGDEGFFAHVFSFLNDYLLVLLSLYGIASRCLHLCG